jgi:hypothetical protein
VTAHKIIIVVTLNALNYIRWYASWKSENPWSSKLLMLVTTEEASTDIFTAVRTSYLTGISQAAIQD